MNLKTNLANPKNYGGTRSTGNIKFIVIHYTANDGDTDENNGAYFKNNVTGTSAHYFVDDDSVTQTVPDNRIAYHCGAKSYKHSTCRNTNSIGIELCDDVKDGKIYPSAQTIANAIELTEYLMDKYNIPKENVIRHYDVTGKLCPAYWVDNAKWKAEFLDKVGDDMTRDEVIKIIEEYEKQKAKNAVSAWAKAAWDKVTRKGVMDGTSPKAPLTREQLAAILDRLGLL